jgi:hypothetical protein
VIDALVAMVQVKLQRMRTNACHQDCTHRYERQELAVEWLQTSYDARFTRSLQAAPELLELGPD